MISKLELMDRLKMTPIGSLSNFRWIGHRMTVHRISTFSHGKIKFNMDGTPNGFETQIKAHGWSYLMLKKLHLKFQVIPTSFDLVSILYGKSATKSSAFPKSRKLCALICTASRQVFFKGIKPINEEKCQRKIQEKI